LEFERAYVHGAEEVRRSRPARGLSLVGGGEGGLGLGPRRTKAEAHTRSVRREDVKREKGSRERQRGAVWSLWLREQKGGADLLGSRPTAMGLVSWCRCDAVGGPGGGVPSWTDWIFASFRQVRFLVC
jgi:hypothetical protein